MKRYFLHILFILAATLIVSTATPAAVAASDTSSLLSRGRWLKVRVDSTGVYRLPAEWLKAQGFDNPEQVIVAGYGSVERAHTLDSAPDDLPILPVRHIAGDILFMAEGDMRVIPDEKNLTVHRNHYSRGSYYYIGISEGHASPEMSAQDTMPDSGEAPRVGEHLCAIHHDFIAMRPYEHGLYSFSDNFAQNGISVKFSHTDAADSAAHIHFTLAWYAATDGTALKLSLPEGSRVASGADSKFTIKRNNLVTNTVYSAGSQSLPVEIPATLDSVSVQFKQDTPAVASLLALRTATMVYPRLNRGTDASRLLHFPGLEVTDRIEFTDLPEGTEVWDISARRSPRRLLINHPTDVQDINTVSPAITGSATLIAFNPGETPVPQIVGEVACQSLREMEDVDMLIVATSVTAEAAERLAEAHRNLQGLKVGVVLQQQVMNEFSSGAIHPNGLRAMVKMLHGRPRPLRYLMLMGRGSSDTRRDFDKSAFESLVTYATEDFTENGNENKCHTADYYFGITEPGAIGPSLSSTLLKADVSVGRVPVDNINDANAYVDKCIEYLSNPRSAGSLNHLLTASCYGDRASHILAAEDIAVNTFSRLLPEATVARSYMDLFPLESTNVSQGTRSHFNL